MLDERFSQDNVRVEKTMSGSEIWIPHSRRCTPRDETTYLNGKFPCYQTRYQELPHYQTRYQEQTCVCVCVCERVTRNMLGKE